MSFFKKIIGKKSNQPSGDAPNTPPPAAEDAAPPADANEAPAPEEAAAEQAAPEQAVPPPEANLMPMIFLKKLMKGVVGVCVWVSRAAQS